MKISMDELIQPGIQSLPIYQPGKPIEEVAREIGIDSARILKLASNENPLGPSPKALEAAGKALPDTHLYPDGSAWKLREGLSGKHCLPMNHFIVGNGSNDVLELLAGCLIGRGKNAVMSEDAFIVYRLATLHFLGEARTVPAHNHTHDLDALRGAIDDNTRIVFVASPNNPTGTANSAAELREFALSLPERVVFCLDQAYYEYDDDPADLEDLVREGRKVLVCRTFSKIHGLAGFRIGYGMAPPELIAAMHRIRPPFNVNLPGMAAAQAALNDHAFIEKSLQLNQKARAMLENGLKALGVPCLSSKGNFVLGFFRNGQAVYEGLLRRGIIVRPVGIYGFPNGIRISVGLPDQTERMLAELEAVLGETDDV